MPLVLFWRPFQPMTLSLASWPINLHNSSDEWRQPHRRSCNSAKQCLQLACGGMSDTGFNIDFWCSGHPPSATHPCNFVSIRALLMELLFCSWSFNSIGCVFGEKPFCTMFGSCFYFSLQWLPLFNFCPTSTGLFLSPWYIVSVQNIVDLVFQVLNNFGPPLLFEQSFKSWF